MGRLIEIVVVDDSTNEIYRNKATIDQDLMNAMNEKLLSNDKPAIDYVNLALGILNKQLDDKLGQLRADYQRKLTKDLKSLQGPRNPPIQLGKPNTPE
jgi:hypothetical protein